MTVQAGWDLLARLRESAVTNAIPVIVTSTEQRFLDRAQEQQERYGGQHFVTKPFDIEVLLATVTEMIGEA